MALASAARVGRIGTSVGAVPLRSWAVRLAGGRILWRRAHLGRCGSQWQGAEAFTLSKHSVVIDKVRDGVGLFPIILGSGGRVLLDAPETLTPAQADMRCW